MFIGLGRGPPGRGPANPPGRGPPSDMPEPWGRPGPRPAGRGPPGPLGPARRTGTAFPARCGRALGPCRRRRTHAGRGRAERVVTRPGAGTRGAGTRTRGTGPGRSLTGGTWSLRPGPGRPGTLTALVLTTRRTTTGRWPEPAPGVLGRGAEGRALPCPWPPPGLRKSAGVAGVRGGPGTRGAPGPSCGRGSAGWEAGDGATGGSGLAAASGADVVPPAAAASGAIARSAEPLAVPSGTLVGAAAVLAAAATRSSRAP